MKKYLRAFTLVELLIVIVIIGILATLATAAISSGRAKARDAKRISDVASFQNSLEMYYNAVGSYPQYATSGEALVNPITGKTYIEKIPTAVGVPDGSCSTDGYTYSTIGDTNSYGISYCLGGKVQDYGPGSCIATPSNPCSCLGLYSVEAFPATAVSVASADWTWNSPSSVSADDGVVASSGGIAPNYTQILKVSNFGFNLPAGASVASIQALVERTQNISNYVYDEKVSLVRANGTIGTTNYKKNTAWYRSMSPTATFHVITYGGLCDLWGEQKITREDVNNSNFGLAFQVKNSTSCLTGNTKISTPEGLVDLASLKVGDKIWAFTESRQMVSDTVKSFISVGSRPTHLLMTSLGNIIEGTENHSFLTETGYRQLADLKAGERLYVLWGGVPVLTTIELVVATNYESPVYDIEVTNNHNFIANNYLVHNPASPVVAGVDYIKLKVYYNR